MFELFAILAVFAICGLILGVIVAALAMLKVTLSLVMLPFKLLCWPVLALVMIVKAAVLVAVGVTVAAVVVTIVGVIAAVILPIVIVAALLAIPVALIAAVT